MSSASGLRATRPEDTGVRADHVQTAVPLDGGFDSAATILGWSRRRASRSLVRVSREAGHRGVQVGLVRAVTSTSMPAAANVSAIPRPMPLLPPVTIADRP